MRGRNSGMTAKALQRRASAVSRVARKAAEALQPQVLACLQASGLPPGYSHYCTQCGQAQQELHSSEQTSTAIAFMARMKEILKE
mgnify:CR=1 FL=1